MSISSPRGGRYVGCRHSFHSIHNATIASTANAAPAIRNARARPVRRQRSRQVQPSSFVSIVICAFSTRDTGQPFLAFSAAVWKSGGEAPGTLARTFRCTAVIVKPASVLSSVTVASVWMLSAFLPALSSCADSAIEKQPACAAAISSSGFVPLPSSKRVLNEYCVSCSTPLCDEIVPRPSFSPPFQTADALRFMLSLLIERYR